MADATPLRQIKIFISSPADVKEQGAEFVG